MVMLYLVKLMLTKKKLHWLRLSNTKIQKIASYQYQRTTQIE